MKMDLNEKIKKLRQENNLTLEELANAIGVSPSTILRYESGEIKNLRRDKIKKLADALFTTPAYLMGWEEEKKDNKSSGYKALSKDEQEILSLYKNLDIQDKAEIKGTIKGMLKSEKYSVLKNKLNA